MSKAMPSALSSRPASRASCRPCSVRSTSTQPVKRFSRFQMLWPWRRSSSLPVLIWESACGGGERESIPSIRRVCSFNQQLSTRTTLARHSRTRCVRPYFPQADRYRTERPLCIRWGGWPQNARLKLALEQRPDMTDAFICDAIRTPIGRYGGALASVRTDDLAALPLKALMARNPAATGERSTMSSTAVRTRRARTTATSPAWRYCLQACRRRCQARLSTGCVVPDSTRSRLPRAPSAAGEADFLIAGGVESMSRAPFVVSKARCRLRARPAICDTTLGWRFVNPLILATVRRRFDAGDRRKRRRTFRHRARGPGCLRLAQPAAGACGAGVGTTLAGNRSSDGFRPAWRAR